MEQLHYETNPFIDRLPAYLGQFIVPQNHQDYTALDHAIWRYVMLKNVNYLKDHAHASYLDGLKQTGIEITTIPNMFGMNRILKEIGWAAVSVDGFIPPNAFMEFQAYKVLVVAADIRQLEHIEYTPAPDIIHESAGHAPIIANPDYSEYLRRLGEIGSKAILSKHDIDMYEAVRYLSILKESGTATEDEIAQAETSVEQLQQLDVELSEMAKVRNLQWWTVEYGLIGPLDDPKIYGAGLLSSIGESKYCLTDEVKKLPYSVKAAYQSFDITKPQPQLYVTPDFAFLMEVLEELTKTLSLRKGGYKGLKKLIESQMIGTIEINTGLQISGRFTDVLTNEDNEVIFFKSEGPTALAYRENEIIGHDKTRYSDGFCSPLGRLKNINLAIEDMGPKDLKAYNFYDGEWLSFEFDSGIKVEGLNVTGYRNLNGKLMIIELDKCTITFKDKVLFQSKDSTFSMSVGSSVVSAFAGSADKTSFPELYIKSKTASAKLIHTQSDKDKRQLYNAVKTLRENDEKINIDKLKSIYSKAQNICPKEWLLYFELLEVASHLPIKAEIKLYLDQLAQNDPQIKKLIEDGYKIYDLNV